MLDLTLLARHQYFPSGKIDLSRFFAGSVLLLFLSGLCGVIAGLLYAAIAIVPLLSYVTILVPIAFGLPIAWMVAKFVSFSHCRNPRLAAFAGAVCGIVTFLSACEMQGVAATLRDGEQKTSLLAVATRTDQIQQAIVRRVFGSGNQLPKRNFFSGFNFRESVMLMIEFGLFIWIPVSSGRNFARRAYGESIDRWLDRSIIRTIPGSGDKIVSVLKEREYLVETLSSLPKLPTHPMNSFPISVLSLSYRASADTAATWLLLEISPFPAANGAYEAYLSATEVDSSGKKRPLLHQLKLRTHEIPTARKLFLGLATESSSDEVANLSDDNLNVETTGLYVQFTARPLRRSASRSRIR